MKAHKSFLKNYFVFLLLFALPFGMELLFVWRAYEHDLYGTIVRIQNQTNAIYGTTLNQNTFSYKLELVRQKKPAVISLGSSRVMYFRQEFFNKSFVNCSGAMNHLNEGLEFIERMFSFHKPEVILLGLDFWWFNDNYGQPVDFRYHKNDGEYLSFSKLTRPFLYLLKNKLNLEQFFEVALLGNKKNEITNYENMGILAIVASDGFRADGSYLLSSRFFGIDDFKDNVLERIEQGKRRFEYGRNISPERVALLEKIIKVCRDHDTNLVVFVPPVSSSVYKKLHYMENKYQFISEFRRYVKRLPVESYDFHNIHDISSEDCECTDGIHIGDVASQRLLLSLAEKKPVSILSGYLDVEGMKSTTRKFKGKVLSIYHPEHYNKNEVDFLKIGCRK